MRRNISVVSNSMSMLSLRCNRANAFERAFVRRVRAEWMVALYARVQLNVVIYWESAKLAIGKLIHQAHFGLRLSCWPGVRLPIATKPWPNEWVNEPKAEYRICAPGLFTNANRMDIFLRFRHSSCWLVCWFLVGLQPQPLLLFLRFLIHNDFKPTKRKWK